MPSDSISFDRAATYYDETRGFPPEVGKQVGEFIAQTANLTQKSRILEVGVGTGRIAIPLSVIVGTVVGVDLSRAMMNRIRPKPGGENVHTFQADITRLPFASQSFDAILAAHVFHLIPDWQNAMSEVARVLRPGGVLLDCGSETDKNEKIDLLWEVWNSVIPKERRQRVGMKSEDYNTLPSQGWQKEGLHAHRYQASFPVSQFVDQLKRRVWSRMWTMRDDDIERGLVALEAVIEEHFESPAEVLNLQERFYMQIWRYTP
jgi:ubiquinone/menaquinone biosynthesis C-methylase UbiE